MVIVVTVGVIVWAWRASNDVLEDFERVNNELQKQVETSAIDPSVGVPVLMKCDSLHLARMKAHDLLDTLRSELALLQMDDYDSPAGIFQHDHRGEALYDAILEYYTKAERVCDNDSLHRLIEKFADPHRSMNDYQDWHMHNVFHVPAVACKTLLSKFDHDMIKTENVIIESLTRTSN